MAGEEPRRARIALLVVFVVALGARLAYLAEMGDSDFLALPVGDAAFYDGWARELAAGDLTASGGSGAVLYQSPGYAWFLSAVYALVGEDAWRARFVQALLGALACALVASATRRALGAREGPRTGHGAGPGPGHGAGPEAGHRVDPWPGICAGGFLALYAPAIHYGALLQKPALALALLGLFLELATRFAARPRARTLLAAGFVCGALALTRENLAVLALALAAGALLAPARGERGAAWRTRGARLAALLAGYLLALAPLGARNLAAGVPLLAGAPLPPLATPVNFGPNFWIGNGAGSDGLYRALRPGRGVPGFEQEDARALAVQRVGRELSDAEVSRHWAARAAGDVRADPRRWLGLLVHKVRLALHDREWMDSQSYLVVRDESRVLRALGLVARFGVLLPLALLGLALAWPRRRALATLYLAPLLVGASIALFFVFGRLRLSLVPLLAPFAGFAAAELARRVRERRWRALRLPALALLAGAVLAFLPTGAAEDPVATTWSNLGSAFARAGRDEDARRAYERALAENESHADARYNLGALLARAGDVAGARENLQRAVTLEPAYGTDAGLALVEAHLAAGEIDAARRILGALQRAALESPEQDYRLGVLLSRAGLAAEAEVAYRRVVTRDPRHADACNNLAFLLAVRGEHVEAVRLFDEALALEPAHALALFNLSRLLAGHPDEELRDPARALELARRYESLGDAGDPGAADLVAMALSSAGRLDEAARLAEEAARAAEERGEADRAAAIRVRAEAYRAGRPYRF